MIEGGYGMIKRFWGAQCIHFTTENTTIHTRISLDFRLIDARYWIPDHDQYSSEPGYYVSCSLSDSSAHTDNGMYIHVLMHLSIRVHVCDINLYMYWYTQTSPPEHSLLCGLWMTNVMVCRCRSLTGGPVFPSRSGRNNRQLGLRALDMPTPFIYINIAYALFVY